MRPRSLTRLEVYRNGKLAYTPKYSLIQTSSSATPERPRELDQRFQMGGQFRSAVDLYSKAKKSLFEPPFRALRGNVRTPSMARWKARGRLYIRRN